MAPATRVATSSASGCGSASAAIFLTTSSGESSSATPAASLTISANGQNVMPSP